MLIGTPKEIKNHEYRVGLTPAGARELKAHGHQVLIQKGAGLGIGMSDAAYVASGAEIVETAAEIFQRAEMIIKVKEPQAIECKMLRPGQVLFTYLHLAPDPEQTKGLIDSGCVAIAYETVTGPGGGLPLLAPMSEVAGRMSIPAEQYEAASVDGASGWQKFRRIVGILGLAAVVAATSPGQGDHPAGRLHDREAHVVVQVRPGPWADPYLPSA